MDKKADLGSRCLDSVYHIYRVYRNIPRQYCGSRFSVTQVGRNIAPKGIGNEH